jgi:hypothetical protein
VVLINLAIVAAVDYGCYLRWVARTRPGTSKSLAGVAEQSGLPAELVHSVGTFLVDARRDPKRLPAAHPGTIRIGAFGDSFTWGDEVPAGLDYPSQLARLLVEQGFDNVEVLNLGNSWIGFGQSFRIWEQLQESHHFDVVLLGPECLPFRDRDTTFNHAEPFDYYYLHGRYVLDGDGARFVDVVGADLQGRNAAYYRFIPAWRYLRYDRNAPPFLRALLPEGRALDNPFYYSALSEEDETDRIYRVLLDRLAHAGPLVLLARDPKVLALGSEAPVSAQLDLPFDFLTRRPQGHLSGSGNLLVARAFQAALSGKSWRRTVLRIDDLPGIASNEPVSLDQVSRIELHAAGKPIASLACELAGTQGLLALKRTGHSLFDGASFVRLERPLRAGMRLELAPAGGGARVLVGETRLLGQLPIGYVEAPVFGERLAGNPHDRLATAQAGRLLLDGEPIYELQPAAGGINLKPIGRGRCQPASLEDTLLDFERMPAAGPIELVLVGKQRSWRVAVANWSRQQSELPLRIAAHARCLVAGATARRAELAACRP